MTSTAALLAGWACALTPAAADLALAERSLLDTLAVTLAGHDQPIADIARQLGEGGRWAAIGHVLDYDDLHMPSTAHLSAVCVPAVLAAGGDARAYLAGAGVMARLGTALGWRHYSAGWHATCTAGAPGAAVAAAVSMGLPADLINTAIALAVPAAGGVQRAFGTDAKSLQVGFAVEAGLRAARLAAAGAHADPAALDDWLSLVGGDPAGVALDGPAVPGGLAIKIYPACYALQRPISAIAGLRVDAAAVTRIVLRTPEATVAPLIQHRPRTGLAGKFSLEYGCAAALLDDQPGFASFTDAAVCRPEADRLVELVEIDLEPGGEGLLTGCFEADIHAEGTVHTATLRHPPGSPAAPPTPRQLADKVRDCVRGLAVDPGTWTWAGAAAMLREQLA